MSELQQLLENQTPYKDVKNYFEARGKIIDQSLKTIWSGHLVGLIWVTIIFQIALTFLVGAKIFTFENNRPFLYIVASENFVQVLGMGYIVVNHLFPTDKNRGGVKSRKGRIQKRQPIIFK